MDSPDQTLPQQWAPPTSQAQPARPARRFLFWIIGALLSGIIVGMLPFVLIFLLGGGDRPAVQSTTSSSKEAVVVRLSKTFLTQYIQKKADFSSLPGTVSNVQVSQIKKDSITITADDQVGMLGLTTTKRFTLELQPIVSNCTVHVRVLHADLQGVPVTNIAATFESQMDQQMMHASTSLPSGFTYCVTGIRTESEAIIVSYSATPT